MNDAELLEQWRPALQLERERRRRIEVRQRQLTKLRNPRRRELARKLWRKRADERLEAQALRELPPGPHLPPYLCRNPRVYVVEQDLEQLPDGGAWWRPHARELELRAESKGLGRSAIVWALLELLVWAYERHLRGGGAAGAGLQVTVDVLARKLGCARSWVYVLLERLEDEGLARRHRRPRRYLYLAREADRAFIDSAGQRQTFRRWRDADGKLREWVDLIGVCYATPKGRLMVRSYERTRTRTRPRARPRPGQALPQGLWESLWTTLRDAARRATARICSAAAPGELWTPDTVTSVDETIISGPRTGSSDPTGPPEEESASRTSIRDALRTTTKRVRARARGR